MDAQSRDVVTWVLGTALSLIVLGGFLVRFVLIPYLRDHLVIPVAETHKQVTENHHRNEKPTLPDRIDDVRNDVRALSRVMDQHLEWSDRWTDLYERRTELLERELQQTREETS